MKAGVEHRVPLSGQALDLLGEASALREESGLVFPSPLKPRAPMSDMTLTKVLRSVGLAERATVHGFRSSFKNWTLEQTDTPWAVSEAALAHTLGNSTEQAYARSDSIRAPPCTYADVGRLPDRLTLGDCGTRHRACSGHVGDT